MNILFVFTVRNYVTANKPLSSQFQIQMGISYISSVLKARGHDTKVAVLAWEKHQAILDRMIAGFQPGLICFTAVATEYPVIAKLAGYVKSKYPGVFLLAGGPHATLDPESVIHDSFDAVCVGEGEYPALELVTQLERKVKPAGIRNLWLKNGSVIQKNDTREFVGDLDALPFPDRDMWQRWIKSPRSTHVVFIGRGCSFNCAYCCNHALRKTAPGAYVRLRSPQKIIDEMAELVGRYPGVKEIYFETESIGLDFDYTFELCDALVGFNRERENLRYGVNLRILPRYDYHRLFHSLRNAQFRSINIGLESGSERIRKTVLRRNYSRDDFLKAVALAKEYGFKVAIFVIIGLPDETDADIESTIDYCRRCQPDKILLSVFYPYPGTDLHAYCVEKGYFSRRTKPVMERTEPVLNLPPAGRRKIIRRYNWFYYHVYRGHKPLWIILLYTLRQILNSRYRTSLFYYRLKHFPLIKKVIKKLRVM